MFFRQIQDPKLAQYAYLIGCQRTGEALIIDPERDVDRYLALAAQEGLRITAVAETHIHADFLSGARELADRVGATLYLSNEGGPEWSYEWAIHGDYDAVLLSDGDRFRVGNIEIQAVHTPGHTPEHLSFLVIDLGGGMREPMGIVSGDFVFVGDLGRPDLLESAAGVAGAMEPSARLLYDSVQQFLDLPDFLQVWPAHGAGSACGKDLGAVPTTTVGYERRANAAIDATRRGREVFVESILSGQPEPPLYFARMKRLNKDGVPPMPELPRPLPVAAGDLAAIAKDATQVVIDTRGERTLFMNGHVRRSLYAPLDNRFPSVVGSFVRPEQAITLIVEEDRLEEAVRDLVRIGFDHIVGFTPPAALSALSDLVSTPTIDFETLETLRREPGHRVLDVRRSAEYEAGHLPGAINVPYTHLLNRLDQIERFEATETGGAGGDETNWLVYCASGARAAVSSALLESCGHSVRYVDDRFANYASTRETVMGAMAGDAENHSAEAIASGPAR